MITDVISQFVVLGDAITSLEPRCIVFIVYHNNFITIAKCELAYNICSFFPVIDPDDSHLQLNVPCIFPPFFFNLTDALLFPIFVSIYKFEFWVTVPL